MVKAEAKPPEIRHAVYFGTAARSGIESFVRKMPRSAAVCAERRDAAKIRPLLFLCLSEAIIQSELAVSAVRERSRARSVTSARASTRCGVTVSHMCIGVGTSGLQGAWSRALVALRAETPSGSRGHPRGGSDTWKAARDRPRRALAARPVICRGALEGRCDGCVEPPHCAV